jgi:hypothetical protein
LSTDPGGLAFAQITGIRGGFGAYLLPAAAEGLVQHAGVLFCFPHADHLARPSSGVPLPSAVFVGLGSRCGDLDRRLEARRREGSRSGGWGGERSGMAAENLLLGLRGEGMKILCMHFPLTSGSGRGADPPASRYCALATPNAKWTGLDLRLFTVAT